MSSEGSEDKARFILEADASGFDQAIEKIDKLARVSARAEKRVSKLQQAVVDAANKAGMGGSTVLPSYQSFQRLSNARYDNNPNLMPPEVRDALNELHGQQEQDKDSRSRKQKDHQANVRDAMGRGRDAAGRFVSGNKASRQQKSWFLHVAQTIGSTRSLNSMGAFASGEEGPLMVNMAALLAQHLLSQHNPLAAYHRGTRALASGAANVIKAPDLSGMPGGVAMGMGQQMMAASMERMLPMMLNMFTGGAIVAGIVAMVMNNMMSHQITTDANLRATVAGAQRISDPLRDQLMHLGQNSFHYDKNTVFQAAMQMGTKGVQAKDMTSAMKLTLSMARLTGQQPSQIGDMTATMMVQGGKSVEQVKDAFLNMRDAAEKSNVPLSKMIDSFNSLSSATGGAAVNVAGLSQLQAQLGPGINAGNLISPLVGSFGFQSMLQSNMLGVPLSQFVNDQQRPEKLMGLVGNFSKNLFGGQDNTQNEEFLGGMLNSMGILNTQGIPPNLMRPLMSSLITGNIADFHKEAGKVQSYEKANPEAGKTWEQQMADLAGGETPWITQMLQHLDTMANDLTTMVNTWMPGIKDAIGGVVGAVGTVAGDVLQLLNPLNWIQTLYNAMSGAVNLLQQLVSHFVGPITHNSNYDTPESITSMPVNNWQYIKGTKFKLGTENGGLWVPTTHGLETAYASPKELGYLMGAATQAKVDPALMLAIAAKESNIGLTSKNVGQLTPIAEKQLEQWNVKGNPFYGKNITQAMVNNPKQNAEMEAWLLRWIETAHHTTNPEIVADYYGPGGPAYGAEIAPARIVIEGELKLRGTGATETKVATVDASGRKFPNQGSFPPRKPKGHPKNHPHQSPPMPDGVQGHRGL